MVEVADFNEDAGFSLADLADLDVTDIAEVRFVQIPAGVFDWEVTKADLAEDEKDGQRRFKAEIQLKILEVKAVLEADVDKESLVGKLHTERFFIKPNESKDKIEEAIGRIRAFVKDMGANNAGKMKDFLPELVGHTFTARIVKQKDRNDPSVTYARLKLEQGKN
jgi:hypothetical protein